MTGTACEVGAAMATREAAQFYGQAESALRDEQFEVRVNGKRAGEQRVRPVG